MYLSGVRIRNFRLFHELDLKLNRGLNVLVGENDAGKTALIDAIRYTLGTNSNDRAYIKETDFYYNESELSIQLTFAEVDKHAYRFVEHLSHEEYEDDSEETKRRSVLHIQLKASNTGTERRGYPYIKTEIRSGGEGNGRAVESEIREFLATTYLRPLRDAQAEFSTGRTSRLSQILSSSKSIKDGIDLILKSVAEANDALIEDGTPLKEAANKIETEYLHELIFDSDKSKIGAHLNIAGVKASEIAYLPDHVKNRHLRDILERLSLAFSNDGHSHGLGYHNLLFMGAELLLLEQERDNEFPLLLIEEPEAHLHPQLQMKLLQFIRSKVKTEQEPDGVQCIISTHSPNISSKVDPSEIIMLAGGKAWPLRKGETELNPEDYKHLQKFLDVTKANVFFAKALLFVEGDAENILLPTLAKLLGRPLENHGVSIVKYDNSGSWKRFARLFLRDGQDGNDNAWHPTKVCVLRDLDLWPPCAEKLTDDSTPQGSVEKKQPNAKGRGGNLEYWETADQNELNNQIAKKMEYHKSDAGESLERQNVQVFISDRWTFEFCLARFGLFKECCKALGKLAISGTEDEKAAFIQKHVSKTDFAYTLADILERQLADKIDESGSAETAIDEFATELEGRLPPYIVDAITYVTGAADA